MPSQKILIDNSYFIFDCINLLNSEESTIFTYKVGTKQTISELIKNYFNLVKEINRLKNFDEWFSNFKTKKLYHYHEINNQKKLNLIENIYLKMNYSKTWITQNISQGMVYQMKMGKRGGESRLFFTKVSDPENNLIIIKPLFIDINHLIYSNQDYPKEYGICLICHQQNCS